MAIKTEMDFGFSKFGYASICRSPLQTMLKDPTQVIHRLTNTAFWSYYWFRIHMDNDEKKKKSKNKQQTNTNVFTA